MKVASKFLFHYGFVEDVDCVVGSAASGRRAPANQPRISNTSNIYSVTVVVVVAPELSVLFCNAVDGAWLLDCELGAFLGSIGTKGCDGAGPEYFFDEAVPGCFEAVE